MKTFYIINEFENLLTLNPEKDKVTKIHFAGYEWQKANEICDKLFEQHNRQKAFTVATKRINNHIFN